MRNALKSNCSLSLSSADGIIDHRVELANVKMEAKAHKDELDKAQEDLKKLSDDGSKLKSLFTEATIRKMDSIETSNSAEDKLSKNSSKVEIPSIKTNSLSSAKIQLSNADKDVESTVSPVIEPALHVEKKAASDSKEEIKEETDEQLANRLKESRKLWSSGEKLIPFRRDYCCFAYCRPGRAQRS